MDLMVSGILLEVWVVVWRVFMVVVSIVAQVIVLVSKVQDVIRVFVVFQIIIFCKI